MKIPREVNFIINELQSKGFEAFIVGGCVRDFLLARRSGSEGGRNVEPEDWDVTTNAKPEEIGKVFLRSYSNNKFGTVTVLTESDNPTLKEIEITPYRIDEKYSDKRHPDAVKWAKTVEEDLSRRDFTINAMALRLRSGQASSTESEQAPSIRSGQVNEIIDPFGGQRDLKEKIVRAVGNAEDRFNEDALRMMRAVRFATTLKFKIEDKTAKAIKKNSDSLAVISKERIRDEFTKIIMAKDAAEGIELLRQLGLLKNIIPELEEGYGVGQNKHHIYDCYDHSIRSLNYAAKQSFNKYVRIAALLHDIAKPRAKRGKGADSTFYNHEILGAKMASQILGRLKFPKKEIEKITTLVRYHLFYYNVEEVSDSSVRRLVRQAGPENMGELLQVRLADRIGSGVPKAEPYKLRHLRYVIEKVSQDPISSTMLAVDGNDVMRILSIKPGPKVGQMLDVLLGEVLSDPKKNKKGLLEKAILKLSGLADSELAEKAHLAKKEREKIEQKRDEMTKKKYWVS